MTMSRTRFGPIGFVLASLLVLSASPLNAQQQLGAIQGTVTDQTRSVLPGVAVTVTNLDTGISRSVSTNDAGIYRVASLDPGRYKVQMELQGFRTATQTDLTLSVGATLGVNVTMSASTVEETVQVTGVAPDIQTEKADLSAVVEKKKIEDLPLVGRNVLSLVALQPGINGIPSTADIFATEQGLGLTANGVRETANNASIDGASINNGPWGGTVLLVPNVEAVQEFQVIANNPSAEYGRNSGAMVSIITRGHQVYRIIEIDGTTATARALLSEEPKTFFCYSGKKFRHDVADGKELIWMSERDGWNHLYLYDGASATMKNQITKGEWVVRSVVHVDEDKRQILFGASGTYPGKDPYFVHYYRINFDGSGMVPLTTVEANHTLALSPDQQFYVDSYSRVDLAPVAELRRTRDASLVMTLERADISELVKAGWKAPEGFVAKGRDGTTDIWGVIYRPENFDPSKKYPVIENIYAGPQSSFVPKSFAAFNQMQAQADIGFIVVQIDGMGTSNRSKAFHDVAWQNIKDAGFPDRILWHKAVAAKYPYYDITRVGLYGNSAGGQNALGGLLFFPDFYKVAVSSAGCHDNRMDKIWWNEQWMGWPLGPQYSASSNVDNAHRLQGHVLLVVGEMDTNVDPSSTMQVVNQLIKHDKDFDLLYIPGGGHGPGGAYGEHKRFDYFVRHLLGVTPPPWTKKELKAPTSDAEGRTR
jgi:putative intracellular protease/amidase